jgi:hypothetical protein
MLIVPETTINILSDGGPNRRSNKCSCPSLPGLQLSRNHLIKDIPNSPSP